MKDFLKQYKNLIKLILAFIIFYFSSFVILFPLSLMKIDYASNESAMYLLSFMVNVFRAILIGALYFNDVKRDFKKCKKNFWEYADIAIKYWLIGLAIMATSNIAINLLTPSKMAQNEESVRSLITAVPVLSLIMTTITAPITEELLFRLSFKKCINHKIAYILISGIVFGALHVVGSYETLTDLLYIIPYSSLGIAFAIICQKTDNILPSMIIHAIHNGAITIVTIIAASSGMIL